MMGVKIRKLGWKLLIIIIILCASFFVPHDPYAVDLENVLISPNAIYPFGTDNLGRCILSRIWVGARVSILSALFVTICIFMIGIIIGAISGYMGGTTDRLLMRFTMITQAFPSFVLSVVFCGLFGSGLQYAMLSLIAVRWAIYARLSRSLILQIRNENYIKAARLCGANKVVILFKYLIPNMMSVLIVTATLDVGNIILTISGLSFLGLGAQPPMIEWGSMISSSRKFLQIAPWFTGFVSLSLFLAVILFNWIGDNLRDLIERKR